MYIRNIFGKAANPSCVNLEIFNDVYNANAIIKSNSLPT